MNKQTIIDIIKLEKAVLHEQFGVEEIALFGSYARGEEKNGSDIDLLVKMKMPSYSLLAGLYDYLEKRLNAKVDVVRKGPHLSSRFLNLIQSELIYA